MLPAKRTVNEEQPAPKSPAISNTGTHNDGLTTQPTTFVQPLVQSLRTRPRRATRACLACRSRKVRCDVTMNYPCGNCRWNHHDCIIHSRRAKRSVNDASPSLANALLIFFPRRTQTTTEGARDQANAAPSCSTESQNTSIPSSEPRREFEKEPTQRLEKEPNQNDNADRRKQGQNWIDAQDTQDLERPGQQPPCLPEASMAETDHLPLLAEGRNKQSALAIPEAPNLHAGYFPQPHDIGKSRPTCLQPMPCFVKPLPINMAVEDMEFLQSKGALTILDTTLREALIQAYLEHVHPLLPVINIEDFVESLIEDNNFNAKVSLLFLQAVMFAGSAYVDLGLLAAAGFKTRKEARTTLYQRVRVRTSV